MTESRFPRVGMTTPHYVDTDLGDVDMDGHRVIYDMDSGKVFAVASNQYKLVTHEEVLENVEEIIPKFPEFGTPEKTLELVNDGGRMKMTYRFPEVEYDIGDGHPINPTLDVYNSYDLAWRHTVLLGAFRFVCTNGMFVGEKFMQYRKRHMQSLYLSEAQKALETGMENMSERSEVWKTWVDKVLKQAEVEKTVEVMKLNQTEEENLMTLKEVTSGTVLNDWIVRAGMGMSVAPMTKWIFFNIITQFLTHYVNLRRRVELENKVRRRFYG